MRAASQPAGLVSVFENAQIEDLYAEVKRVYASDSRPWVIGYSGGKDSTAVLQLVWYALLGLEVNARKKRVYVISSDTLVETPVIVNHVDDTLNRINEAAEVQGLPFEAHKVYPRQDETFWVNLIGRGYPAPSTKFRWCTDRMKIQPANRFILDCVSRYGEAVVILGVRESESSTRAQVMSLHRIEGSPLSRHTKLRNAFVYAPIRHFSIEDVWSYLLSVPSPWGSNNRDLLAFYRNAQAGECPLVIDTTTPSCGNSRFGCWTCTVVERDKTMEALIDNGENWMEGLLELRDFLASTQDPAAKSIFRDYRRSHGQISFSTSGRLIRGPYRLEVCKDILRRVLETQQRVRAEGPDPSIVLISESELHEIRRIWRTKRQDWDDSVPAIYREVTGEDLDWPADDAPGFGVQDRSLLEEIATTECVPAELVARLIDAERQHYGMARRSRIFSRIDDILGEEWRPEEEIVASCAPESEEPTESP